MNKTKSPSRKSVKMVKVKKTKKGPVRYVIGSVGRMTRSLVGTTFDVSRSVGKGARSLVAAAKGKTRKTSRRHKRKIVRSQAAMKAMK